MTDYATALVYAARGETDLRQVALPPLRQGMAEIRTLFSSLSRGTERLVFEGRVPPSEYTAMRAPFQDGDFPFPVKYGYAAAGIVEAGPSHLIGRQVFALYPHQDRFRIDAAAVVPLPRGVPPQRAILAANAETALNGIWDAAPGPGMRVAVVGAGLLGALVAMFLSSTGNFVVTVSDIVEERAALFTDFPVIFRRPGSLSDDHDIVFHTSATPSGLETALSALAFEGTCIELSWFGAEPVAVPLGAAFHSRRLTLRSSQVGHVAPSHRPNTTRRARLEQALAALADPRFDRLITGDVRFRDLPAATSRLLAPGASGIATRIIYGER